MVRRCCIVTCRNGGSSECDDKVSYFKVPSEQALFEKWVEAIERTGSELYKTSAVCERHFRKDQIRREAVLKDHFGNVILQRPLTKVSLVKEAVPSIFEKDIENPAKKRKKRRIVIPNTPENINTIALPNLQNSFIINSDGNIINCSNILLTFNENLSNLVNLNVIPSNLDTEMLSANDKVADQNYKSNEENVNTILTSNPTNFVNGQESIFTNGFINTNQIGNNQNNNTELTDSTNAIKIYIKPQEVTKSNVSSVDNSSINQTFNSLDTSIIDKQQLLHKIPNEFNNNNDLNMQLPKEVTIIVPEEEIRLMNEMQRNNSEKNVNVVKPAVRNKKQKIDQPKNTGTIHYPLPESDIQMNIRVFDLIFYNSHKIKLPSPMWGYHKNNIDKNLIIFSKAKWFKSDVLIPPIYEKQVIFHENENIKIYINNKFSPLEVRRPKDIHEMELILKHVDETVVCEGGPSTGECDTAHCAQKDYAVNKWRHKLCPIIISSDEKKCKFCSTINQVLRYPKKKKLPFGKKPPPSPKRSEDEEES